MTYTAIHRALGRDPGPITDQLINDAVGDGVEETDDLDWKKHLPSAKGLAQSDWPKDVAAMSNSGGGIIVFGVTEDQKAAKELADAGELDEGLERSMRSAAATAITPPVFGLTFHKVETEGKRAVAVEIPASPESPHLIYNNHYFGAPIRNNADTYWMRERQLEAAYRARFDERRHAHEALDRLHEEAAAGRDTQHRAWLVFAAHPRVPVLSTSLEQTAASNIFMSAKRFADALTKGKGVHPLDVVERQNLRPGLQRWVARYRPAWGSNWDEAWISIHHDGSVTVAAAVGAHRGSRSDEYRAGNEVEARAIEAALADAMGLVRATASATSNSDYDIRVSIQWDGDEPLMITTVDVFGYGGNTDYTIPVQRFVPVEATVDARTSDARYQDYTVSLARDCINQGGIGSLQLISPSPAESAN